MNIKEVEQYIDVIIPNIEKELLDKDKTPNELLELYNLYEEVLTLIAPYNFIAYNKCLEFHEDKTRTNKGFYHFRKNHISEIFEALNDMEIYDKYDMLIISTPPRIGKTTIGIRFLSWIIGKFPEHTQLATSYSESITNSFYAGVMEIIQGEQYNKIFPESILVNQNAKRQEIWLKVAKRYPSISFVSISGSMTGRSEASKYIYLDDLVSGIEEALSPTRMDKLWELYTVNARQRKLDGAKEIVISTIWSLHDPVSRLIRLNEDNPRCKIIKLPALDENDESNFHFEGGFSTKFYHDMRKGMDKLSFDALYMCEAIEREGLLYHKDDLMYYFDLPEEEPDTIVGVIDSKNLGKDYVSMPIGYVYGDNVYVEDVVYNNGLPEVTIPLVANKLIEHKVVRCDCELNNGGNYYAENVSNLIKEGGGNTSMRMFFTGNNKTVKIITYADFVTKQFIFRDPSTYTSNSPYGKFMEGIFSWTQTGKNKFDDSVDSLAMLAQMVQELNGNEVKVMNRRKLGI